jgi:nucleotide-binding universal stress UspA family protein
MAWIVSAKSTAAGLIVLAAVGCNGFGRVVDSSPIDDEDVIRDDSGFTVVNLDYDWSEPGVAWSFDGKSLPVNQVIPRLEERLKDLGVERMRVVVTEPKRICPEPNPTFDDVRKRARDRGVSLRIELATGHVRGVTFGRTIKQT